MSAITALPIDENSRTVEGTFRNMASGTATVVTAGVPVQLSATAHEAKRLDITAGYGNTDIVTIGGIAVVGAQVGRKGIPIAAGNTYTFAVTDISNVWLDAVHSGDTVSYNYFY